jgi:hypothetical protein
MTENILFGLGINVETVVETNISDMCTININIIQISHSIEEKEIKNLENLLSKHLTNFNVISNTPNPDRDSNSQYQW